MATVKIYEGVSVEIQKADSGYNLELWRGETKVRSRHVKDHKDVKRFIAHSRSTENDIVTDEEALDILG